jgi:hypothetical protein
MFLAHVEVIARTTVIYLKRRHGISAVAVQITSEHYASFFGHDRSLTAHQTGAAKTKLRRRERASVTGEDL